MTTRQRPAKTYFLFTVEDVITMLNTRMKKQSNFIVSFVNSSEILSHTFRRPLKGLCQKISVPDHDGGRPEEVNSCVLNSYMVYL